MSKVVEGVREEKPMYLFELVPRIIRLDYIGDIEEWDNAEYHVFEDEGGNEHRFYVCEFDNSFMVVEAGPLGGESLIVPKEVNRVVISRFLSHRHARDVYVFLKYAMKFFREERCESLGGLGCELARKLRELYDALVQVYGKEVLEPLHGSEEY